MTTKELYQQAVSLLKQLISTPSFSKEENDTAEIICSFFQKHEVPFARVGNNIYAKNKQYDISYIFKYAHFFETINKPYPIQI